MSKRVFKVNTLNNRTFILTGICRSLSIQEQFELQDTLYIQNADDFQPNTEKKFVTVILDFIYFDINKTINLLLQLNNHKHQSLIIRNNFYFVPVFVTQNTQILSLTLSSINYNFTSQFSLIDHINFAFPNLKQLDISQLKQERAFQSNEVISTSLEFLILRDIFFNSEFFSYIADSCTGIKKLHILDSNYQKKTKMFEGIFDICTLPFIREIVIQSEDYQQEDILYMSKLVKNSEIRIFLDGNGEIYQFSKRLQRFQVCHMKEVAQVDEICVYGEFDVKGVEETSFSWVIKN